MCAHFRPYAANIEGDLSRIAAVIYDCLRGGTPRPHRGPVTNVAVVIRKSPLSAFFCEEKLEIGELLFPSSTLLDDSERLPQMDNRDTCRRPSVR